MGLGLGLGLGLEMRHVQRLVRITCSGAGPWPYVGRDWLCRFQRIFEPDGCEIKLSAREEEALRGEGEPGERVGSRVRVRVLKGGVDGM